MAVYCSLIDFAESQFLAEKLVSSFIHEYQIFSFLKILPKFALSFFKILPELGTSWKLTGNFAKLSKGCFSRSHIWFVYIQFLIPISSPWTPWSKIGLDEHYAPYACCDNVYVSTGCVFNCTQNKTRPAAPFSHLCFRYTTQKANIHSTHQFVSRNSLLLSCSKRFCSHFTFILVWMCCGHQQSFYIPRTTSNSSMTEGYPLHTLTKPVTYFS